MIDSDEAKAVVLRHCEGPSQGKERFAIQSCELSARGDYWIVRANTEDCVLRGMTGRCYVGANAHLVDTASGTIETVGCMSVDEYLEDKYDAALARDGHYVLGPAFEKGDKKAVIRLRQTLGCSPQRAMQLISPEFPDWFTGTRRVLRDVQEMLRSEGIDTTIRLQDNPGLAVPIDYSVWHLKALKAALSRLQPA